MEKDIEKLTDNVKISFKKELDKLIIESRYQKLLQLANEMPNDMDLGRAIRSILGQDIQIPKPPFTQDYIMMILKRNLKN